MDSAIEVKVGDNVLAKVYNHGTVIAGTSTDMRPCGAFVPKDNEIIIECVDAFPAEAWLLLYIIPTK